MSIRNSIKSFVALHSWPVVSDLYAVDKPSFEMVLHLLKLISSIQFSVQSDGVGGYSFTTPSGQTLLLIDSNGNFSGDLAKPLSSLLIAARIHEVESYEWVNYTHDMRASLLDQVANRAGESRVELKRLSNIWVNDGY